MKKHLSLYLYFAKQIIRGELVHRASFLAGVVGQWLSYGGTYLTLFIMIESFHTLGGWNAREVLFMTAFSFLSYAMAATVFYNPTRNLAAKIRSGEFDASLTKPVDPLWHEVYSGFNFGYIGHTVLSIAMMIVSLPGTRFSFTLWGCLLLALMLFGSALVQAALLLLPSVFSFFMVGDNPAQYFFSWGLKRFVDYPISIYSRAIQLILTFIFPYAFLNFYPVGVVLGLSRTFPFPVIVAYLSPAVGAALFFFSVKAWRWALSRYQSTGS